MKSNKIAEFINGLITYDYILFASSFILFVLLIILAIIARKRVTLAVTFVLLGFATLLLGPTLGYIKLHEYLFKHTLLLTTQKKLSFSEAVVVKGSLTNESERNFKSCKITASAYKVTKNEYKNYINKLKPFQDMSIFEYDVAKGETRDFKLFIEPFVYEKDYNVTLGADCR